MRVQENPSILFKGLIVFSRFHNICVCEFRFVGCLIEFRMCPACRDFRICGVMVLDVFGDLRDCDFMGLKL